MFDATKAVSEIEIMQSNKYVEEKFPENYGGFFGYELFQMERRPRN